MERNGEPKNTDKKNKDVPNYDLVVLAVFEEGCWPRKINISARVKKRKVDEVEDEC